MEELIKYLVFRDYMFPIILAIVITLIVLIPQIVCKISNKFKKNCFNCKHYKLSNVASAGDTCWYRCSKTQKENMHSMNDKEHFEKCSEYKEEGD